MLRRDPRRGAEPGIATGPAVQQADALLFELRRTLIVIMQKLLHVNKKFLIT
jgi:hypothetical protein